MKNIYVLPTNKSSKLCKDGLGTFYLTEEMISKVPFFKNQHIYITSDEEIKEGDWFVHSSHGTTTLLKCKSINLKEVIDNEGKVCWIEYSKKIILTTDKMLVDDGVEQLTDDFLTWFTQHQNCTDLKINK